MRTLKTLISATATLLLIVLGTGCSKDGAGINGPDTASEPATRYYDVTVTIHRFHIDGDCDGGALPNDGEISYGIELKRETAPGSGVYQHVKYIDAKGYPSETGTKYKRSDGENLNIKEQVFVGRLEEGCNYQLIASAIEWDGLLGDEKDDRMGGSPRVEVDQAGGKAHYEHKLTLGSGSSCQFFLYFDCDETLLKN